MGRRNKEPGGSGSGLVWGLGLGFDLAWRNWLGEKWGWLHLAYKRGGGGGNIMHRQHIISYFIFDLFFLLSHFLFSLSYLSFPFPLSKNICFADRFLLIPSLCSIRLYVHTIIFFFLPPPQFIFHLCVLYIHMV